VNEPKRLTDEETGVVCYYTKNAISCVVVDEDAFPTGTGEASLGSTLAWLLQQDKP
jgi:hypothetical protein